MSTTVEELDQIMGFGKDQNAGEGFEQDIVVEDGWYWCRLAHISKPFPKVNPKNGKEVMKAAFEFRIFGEKGKGGTAVETDYAGGRLTSFINIGAWGDKSVMQPLCSALLGMDANQFRRENGRQVLPSDILGKECWVRVSTTADDEGNMKSWPQEYRAELPKIPVPVNKQATTLQPTINASAASTEPGKANKKPPF